MSHVKVHVTFPPGGPVAGEFLWATPHGDGGELYRIANIPFYATGVAYGDVVRAVPVDGTLEVVAVVAASGQRTVSVEFAAGVGEAPATGTELTRLGVLAERATGSWYALSVPLEAQDRLAAMLAAWTAGGLVVRWSDG